MKAPLRCAPCRMRRQSGFTLIELMVSIVIALFVSGAISVIFLNLRSTFNSQDRFSQLHENQRLAITALTTTLQSAGYFLDPVSHTLAAALPASTVNNPDGTGFAAAQSISGTQGVASDTVNVRYQTASGDGIMNCLGASNTSGANTVWVNSFALNAAHELTCSVNGATAVALVNNVNSMTLLYGVDTDGDGNADTYLDATVISAASLWSNVYTARVTLSFFDPTPGATGALPHPWVQTIKLMNRT